MILIICCIVWFIFGIISGVLLSETDITVGDLPVLFLCGLGGCIILVGYLVDNHKNVIIFKKKEYKKEKHETETYSRR